MSQVPAWPKVTVEPATVQAASVVAKVTVQAGAAGGVQRGPAADLGGGDRCELDRLVALGDLEGPGDDRGGVVVGVAVLGGRDRAGPAWWKLESRAAPRREQTSGVSSVNVTGRPEAPRVADRGSVSPTGPRRAAGSRGADRPFGTSTICVTSSAAPRRPPRGRWTSVACAAITQVPAWSKVTVVPAPSSVHARLRGRRVDREGDRRAGACRTPAASYVVAERRVGGGVEVNVTGRSRRRVGGPVVGPVVRRWGRCRVGGAPSGPGAGLVVGPVVAEVVGRSPSREAWRRAVGATTRYCRTWTRPGRASGRAARPGAGCPGGWARRCRGWPAR